MKRLLPMLALLVLVAGPGPVLAGEPAEQPARDGPSRVALPRELDELQARLDALPPAGDCASAYTAHKAQAWLNFGAYAAAEQLPARVGAAARANTTALLESLAHGAGSEVPHPELPGARHLRDDLWRSVAAVKSDGRVCGAPKMTAYCEVQLAWAGYEAAAGGWRHTDPYVRIAEDYCATAAAAQAPPPAPPPDEPAAPAPEGPVAAAPPAAAPPEAPERALTVLFPHDRSHLNDIRRPGRALLRALAHELRAHPKAKLTITGNADITGKAHYNQRLSLKRAHTVARALESLGVPRQALAVSALGDTSPVVSCLNGRESGDRRRYFSCLEPNRRVTVRVDFE
ncbi:MAG: OmpA family protein [Proteobacteria bacterium]|nr:OmpA family protein [Pseudomonadota bacterium]